WNVTRFRVLGRIRGISLRAAAERACDFYCVIDIDNFVRPGTLKALVALNLPIVAPLLRSVAPDNSYSNYHAAVDDNGYFSDCELYHRALHQQLRGVLEMPVVHCAYVVRSDVVRRLTYEDGSDRYEYVVFSASAREAGIPQYLDNREIYGYVTFG